MNKNKEYTAEEKRDLHLTMMFSLMKKRAMAVSTDARFNNTEIRLLAEILSAHYEGKRLISTQLADLLGITRSAVSQIVNNLEKENVVKRVADDVDRKIAYIEVTDTAFDLYRNDLENCKDYVGQLVERFGEDKFYQLCDLFDEFMEKAEAFREELVPSKKKGKKSKKKGK